jgi:hypothetical protein
MKISRCEAIKLFTGSIPTFYASSALLQAAGRAPVAPLLPVNSPPKPFFPDMPRTIADRPFKPTWESPKQYKVPDWFRDAKFGIWAHWTAQCVPEHGDWYARNMYIQGQRQYNYHVRTYGHPSEFGFMEIDNLWKAEKWNPVRIGPKKDLIKGRAEATRKAGLCFGVTNYCSHAWHWLQPDHIGVLVLDIERVSATDIQNKHNKVFEGECRAIE